MCSSYSLCVLCRPNSFSNLINSQLRARRQFLKSSQLRLNYCSSRIMDIDGPLSNEMDELREGKAKILFKKGSKVFYNPVQEFNRDLSIAVLSLYAQQRLLAKGESIDNLKPGIIHEKGIRVLEALSATGLRSIRFALEAPGLKEVVANDISELAVETIKENAHENNADNLITVSCADALYAMQKAAHDKKWFDVIDLDPYGCPTKFLNPAMGAITDGGLLMVTCTDMAVLAGNTPESCYVKYGATSLRIPACHEMALRIALKCIESHANVYGKYITPLLSISADFYIRVFVIVSHSPVQCKKSTSKLSHVHMCVGCKSTILQPLGIVENRESKPPLYKLPRFTVPSSCPHCGSQYIVGGPIWTSSLKDELFVDSLIDYIASRESDFATFKRMFGMLNIIKDELPIPLYYSLNSLCSVVHCEAIPLLVFRSALLSAGYRVSESHACCNSIKTDAPDTVIWDIIRQWVIEHPISEKRKTDLVKTIMSTAPQTKVSFEVRPEAKPSTYGLLRYQVNPLPNWGPGMRSTINSDHNKKRLHEEKNKKSKVPKLEDGKHECK